MEFWDWVLVNIVAPLLLPILGILPLALLPKGIPTSGVHIMSTVKDGQLCWAVIAMGTSTTYELWEAHKNIPDWGGLALFGVIIMMLPAMVVAAVGAVFGTPLRSDSGGGCRAWLMHYRVFVFSAVLAVIAAVVYAGLHRVLVGYFPAPNGGG